MTLVDDGAAPEAAEVIVATQAPDGDVAATAVERRTWRARVRHFFSRSNSDEPDTPLPPLDPKLQLVRAVLVLILVLSVSVLVELLVLSGVQQRSSQQRLFDSFRADLAAGTAPVGATDAEGRVLASGSAMAYLEIPSIGVRQVVVQGTSSGVMLDGPGHRLDSPFPGQAGTSVIMGRRASFGGPFLRLPEVQEGDQIRVTTGQGESDYEVIGVRRDGDPLPAPLQSGEGRLLLMTADGRPFVPDGVVRVDARLVTTPQPGRAQVVTASTLPPPDQPMASDTSTIWALVFWLQALLVASVAFVWAWHRWSRAKAWIVMTPVLLVIGLFVAQQGAKLLPNMF